MKKLIVSYCTFALVGLSGAVHAQNVDVTEVDTVVAAVKAANPNMRAVCQSGPDGIRKATMEVLMGLMGHGKIKGNPQSTGTEAGMKIGRECRG